MIKKHIPNTITCGNLVSGCIATAFALQAKYELALTFIIVGAVFDFFDGFTARLLRVSSPIGKELDSLADDITFGFAPAAVLFSLLSEVSIPCSLPLVKDYFPYVAYLIAAFSALRLAKFNLDERQSTTFLGLPTPANALFWSALVVGGHDWLVAWPHSGLALTALALLSCWLLVSEVPMFALKFKHFCWRGNALRYGFIAVSAALLVAMGWTGFSLVIVCYVLVSLLNNLLSIRKN